jgi:hypothetical protein
MRARGSMAAALHTSFQTDAQVVGQRVSRNSWK